MLMVTISSTSYIVENVFTCNEDQNDVLLHVVRHFMSSSKFTLYWKTKKNERDNKNDKRVYVCTCIEVAITKTHFSHQRTHKNFLSDKRHKVSVLYLVIAKSLKTEWWELEIHVKVRKKKKKKLYIIHIWGN